MRRYALLLVPLCIANLGQAPAVKGGTVTGEVRAVAKGKPVKVVELYVYLEGGPTKPSSALGAKVTTNIEQKDRQFEPRVAVIPRGATVFFPNRDNQDHNVFSPSIDLNHWHGFENGIYRPKETGKERKFLQDGEFNIYCNLHREMSAKVKVVPTRYFAKVENGKFALTDVVPGTYKLVAWAPDSLETRSVEAFEVQVDKTTTAPLLNLQYRNAPSDHRRADGSEYETGYEQQP